MTGSSYSGDLTYRANDDPVVFFAAGDLTKYRKLLKLRHLVVLWFLTSVFFLLIATVMVWDTKSTDFSWSQYPGGVVGIILTLALSVFLCTFRLIRGTLKARRETRHATVSLTDAGIVIKTQGTDNSTFERNLPWGWNWDLVIDKNVILYSPERQIGAVLFYGKADPEKLALVREIVDRHRNRESHF